MNKNAYVSCPPLDEALFAEVSQGLKEGMRNEVRSMIVQEHAFCIANPEEQGRIIRKALYGDGSGGSPVPDPDMMEAVMKLHSAYCRKYNSRNKK